jgi:signal transduction histidine kinase
MLWAIQTLIKNPDGNLNEQQKTMLQDMYKSAESSTATINEILDLSVFERGLDTAANFSDIDVLSAIHEVQKTLNLGAQEKNIKIVLDNSMPIAATTKGDINALRRAFMNIVSNSIKYAFEGTEINIGYRAQGSNHVFVIHDQGIGIPSDEQAKVIEGYYRAKNATKVQAHGTGLGLWITRLIIEQHGGKLWLESQENKGTTMFVSLPKVGSFTDQTTPTGPAPTKSLSPPHQA